MYLHSEQDAALRDADQQLPSRERHYATAEHPSQRLDPGIAGAVHILADAGIETIESCEGGPDHAYPEPTVRFVGGRGAGYAALAVALQHGLPAKELRRVWSILDGELTGPEWELVFSRHVP